MMRYQSQAEAAIAEAENARSERDDLLARIHTLEKQVQEQSEQLGRGSGAPGFATGGSTESCDS